MTTSTSPTERAQEAASTAADESRHVAGVAKDEAKNVASTAADQARSLVNEALEQVSGQVGEQATTQRDRLVGTLQSLSDDLRSMADQSDGSGLAAELARQVADRARSLGSHLDGREPGELLDDVRQFARRRPGTFLLGALAAGVVAGRLVRGAKDGVAGAAVAEGQAADRPSVPPVAAGAFDAPAGLTPPMPSALPGQPTVEPPTTVIEESGPVGTPASGYAERGGLGEQR
jgi:hypothetical protein